MEDIDINCCFSAWEPDIPLTQYSERGNTFECELNNLPCTQQNSVEGKFSELMIWLWFIW